MVIVVSSGLSHRPANQSFKTDGREIATGRNCDCDRGLMNRRVLHIPDARNASQSMRAETLRVVAGRGLDEDLPTNEIGLRPLY
ncbi:hypothetical protein [Mesorhizobium sp. L-8-3]|uniref:hypothetical protein n=1 Tax=Mesorhizobium sp. L-8-3 TaxID=2744522 RepID=UPI0019278D47|nr:hypothetical protein [Mesorhizobium sp. L-8-3]